MRHDANHPAAPGVPATPPGRGAPELGGPPPLGRSVRPATSGGRARATRIAARGLERAGRGVGVVASAAANAGGRTGLALGRRGWESLSDALPRVPVRDLSTLRAQHNGLEGEELADSLVRGATVAVAAVGITGGVAAFSSSKVPAWMVTIPVTIATEALLVAAIEAKLIAELHEVYQVPLRPGSRTRGAAVLGEWAARRDIDPLDPRSLRVLAGFAVRQRGARTLTHTAGRATRFGSAVVGGVAGASTHKRNLGELAHDVRAELRARRGPTSRWAWGR